MNVQTVVMGVFDRVLRYIDWPGIVYLVGLLDRIIMSDPSPASPLKKDRREPLEKRISFRIFFRCVFWIRPCLPGTRDGSVSLAEI